MKMRKNLWNQNAILKYVQKIIWYNQKNLI